MAKVKVSTPAINWCFGTFVHAIISEDLCDAQSVVAEDSGSSLGLCRSMQRTIAPGADGFFVAPERERKQLAGFGQAPKPFD